MPTAHLNGVDLFYESTGEGFPVIWCHEYAGDYRSWGPQVRAFARLYRNLTWSYRGFLPSGVPGDRSAYSEEHIMADLLALLDHLGIQQAHLVGLSMGASMVLHFALRQPLRCRSIVVAGAGSGTTKREAFEQDARHVADVLLTQGMQACADFYTRGPSRLPFLRKDPRGWQEFHDLFAGQSALGHAYTMLGVQLKRKTIYDHSRELPDLRVPTLILVGDEDEACIDPSVFMKRRIPVAGLAVFPQSGHTLNLEEPDAFNQAVQRFFHQVEHNAWATRQEVSTSLLPERQRR
jgi:pimeloyl-ACP methyl ester carboxylesterase